MPPKHKDFNNPAQIVNTIELHKHKHIIKSKFKRIKKRVS